DAALERLGRAERKGAPDTFDAAGYVALLQRLRTTRPTDPPVWAPMCERDLEQPLAGAIEVPADVPLVITEGNYLLCGEGPWAQGRILLDACWFVEVPEALRHERLISRHERFGKPPRAARDGARAPDESHARLVAATRDRADDGISLPRRCGRSARSAPAGRRSSAPGGGRAAPGPPNAARRTTVPDARCASSPGRRRSRCRWCCPVGRSRRRAAPRSSPHGCRRRCPRTTST